MEFIFPYLKTEGDFDNGYVSVGNGISQINKIKSVKELIDELMV